MALYHLSRQFISTHILTRRMTCFLFFVFFVSIVYFNSHPHKEDDSFRCYCCICIMSIFQLTSSQGGWLTYKDQKVRKEIFQLTSSQGGWPFIHGSGWGMTVFQLTSSQGGWRYSSHVLPLKILFQLTSSQGGWPGKIPNSLMKVVFQLTSSQGGWRIT